MRSIFYQLPSCNLFTQHVSYLLWRDTTSELWTPIHSFTLIIQPTAIIVPFHSLQLNTIFHTICLILCLQQASEIDNLTVLLGQSSLIVLCADSTLAPDSLVLRRAIFRHQQPSEVISCSYWSIKPWFHTEGKLLLHCIIPSSWGLPTNV